MWQMANQAGTEDPQLAEARYLELIEAMKRVHGADHRNTLGVQNTLSYVYSDQGRFEEAEALTLHVLEGRRRVLGDDHPVTQGSIMALANLYSKVGRLDEAEALQAELLMALRESLGEDHLYTLYAMNNLAITYTEQGRFNEAEALLEDHEARARRTLGDEHSHTLNSVYCRAESYRQAGRFEEAESLYRQIIDSRIRATQKNDAWMSVWGLARIRLAQSDFDGAEELFDEALAIFRQRTDDRAYIAFGEARVSALFGRRQEALQRLRESVEHGYYPALFRYEKDLASLRDDPEFQALLADDTGKALAQR